jgi:hypothetical protein
MYLNRILPNKNSILQYISQLQAVKRSGEK